MSQLFDFIVVAVAVIASIVALVFIAIVIIKTINGKW